MGPENDIKGEENFMFAYKDHSPVFSSLTNKIRSKFLSWMKSFRKIRGAPKINSEVQAVFITRDRQNTYLKYIFDLLLCCTFQTMSGEINFGNSIPRLIVSADWWLSTCCDRCTSWKYSKIIQNKNNGICNFLTKWRSY